MMEKKRRVKRKERVKVDDNAENASIAHATSLSLARVLSSTKKNSSGEEISTRGSKWNFKNLQDNFFIPYSRIQLGKKLLNLILSSPLVCGIRVYSYACLVSLRFFLFFFLFQPITARARQDCKISTAGEKNIYHRRRPLVMSFEVHLKGSLDLCFHFLPSRIDERILFESTIYGFLQSSQGNG